MLNRRTFLGAVGIASTAGASPGGRIKSATMDDTRQAEIPDLDELASQWMSFADIHVQPAVASTLGACAVGADMLSIESLAFPPFTQGPQGIGTLTIDGHALKAAEYRWFPYQVLRRATTWDGAFELQSAVRISCADNIVLFRLTLRNRREKISEIHLHTDLQAPVRRYDQVWQWAPPRPENAAEFNARRISPNLVRVTDSRSTAVTTFGFAGRLPDEVTIAAHGALAIWKLSVPRGQTATIDMVMVVGSDGAVVAQQASQTTAKFHHAFESCKSEWEKTFRAAFTPGNTVFSGHLPVLRSGDSKFKRIYYVSVASLLCSLRTCFPGIPRAYVTGAPQDAVSLMYFWDTCTWATVFALLDPAMMRARLVTWLKMNIHSCYAQDMLSGKGVGPWYSFNDYSVFSLILTYVKLTGDRAFLNERVGGRPIMDQLEQMALWWKRLVKPGSPMADYGGRWNLLECVPTYTHIVASLNAANVWMMRQVAALRDEAGEHARADVLRKQASQLARQVLTLYMKGAGYWCTLQPDGRKIPVRHCIDFFTLIMCMKGDLITPQLAEMVRFASEELITRHWMRALSLDDFAAPESNRPDHGPMGAYTAWPAFTIEALGYLGRWDMAAEFLRHIAVTTELGPFGQSDELLTAEVNTPVRKAGRGGQMYYCSCAGSFAAMIIRTFFGISSVDINGLNLSEPHVDRKFEGELIGVPAAGRLFNIRSDPHGLHVAIGEKGAKKAGEGI